MKRYSAMIVFGIWMLTSMQCWADDSLGRLFYTPEQRARMDVARQHERSIKIDEEESTPPPVNIHLNGVITRSDGRSTVWINNRIQNDTSQVAAVGKGGEVRVVTPDAQRTIRLKVGQSIDMSSGEVEEVYRRTPSATMPEKERPSALTSPGAEKLPISSGRKDDAPVDIEGEIPSPR
ncbi:MAG: hypothetical protein ABIG70_00580 [Pseudomonadota bacterium]|jgi:hypothetical protein